ncbi:TetR/AcrR family transcriptional regulator [Pseudonocardia sp. NPDC049154]|uniref:TetR/AcrR family transcriptional regulator n=1 Tax=Pseudonocardia sp. NPDC049154 TaxID=3155501 RepID=UPI0034105E2B
MPPRPAKASTERDWLRPSKGEERRADLLHALEGMLAERRLAEIGVDDIAGAAGVRRTAFYFYFANKAAAVAALLEDAFDALIAGAQDFLGRGGDPIEALRDALTALWESWRVRRSVMLAMFDARDIDESVRGIWDEWLESFVEPVGAVVREERATGRAPAGPDPAVLVRLLVGMNASALERWCRGGHDEVPADVVEGMVHVWVTALYGRADAQT